MSEELELLERVLMRLGCADTDEQLQTAVNKFLCPVLLKITSPHENVRLKVMEVLTHINKRLKSRPLVQIPLEPIIDQYQASESSFAINFSIIYITMGFPRMEPAKQTELAPKLLNCLEGKPEMHQDKLLMLVLPLLETIKFPSDIEQRNKLLGLSDKPSTRKQFISVLEDVLLLPYGLTQEAEVPPGMSPYAFKRVTANNWKAEELERLKKGIVRLLCSGVFSDIDILCALIIASADTRFSVATPAIAEVGKFSTTLDWTKPSTSDPLYDLFCGNKNKIPDRKTTPCNARVRQKLLQYLLKCHGNGINVPKGIQVIFESLFGENTNKKCKVLALQFSENLVKEGPRELIAKLSRVLLSGFQKLINQSEIDATNTDVLIAAYNAIAQLARTCPHLFNADLQLVVTYFKNLAEAPTEISSAIRDALVAIAPAFCLSSENDMETDSESDNNKKSSNQHLLLALLAEHIESPSTIVLNVVCVYIKTCFPETFVPGRYLLLIIAGRIPQLRESATTHLYGISKKDNIHWNYLTSIDVKSEEETDITGHQSQIRVILPSFKEMINYTSEMSEKRLLNPQLSVTHGKVLLPFDVETFVEILDYLRICLWYSAGSKSRPGNEKEIYLLSKYVVENYSTTGEIQKYLDLIKMLVKARGGYNELVCLLDLLNVAPEKLAPQTLDMKEKLSETLKAVSEDIRMLVGQLWGILFAYGEDDKRFDSEIAEILTKIPQLTLEHKHGSVIAIANAFHWKIKIFIEKKMDVIERVNKWKEFDATLKLIIGLLSTTIGLMISAGVRGISLIGLVVKLPLSENDDSTVEKMDVDNEPAQQSTSKLTLLNLLVKLISNPGLKNKTREDAADCLSHLANGDKEFYLEKVLQSFLSMAKLKKDPAIQIAMGQALICTIQGYRNLRKDSENANCSDALLEKFLKDLIRIVPSPNPNSRQACSIWLLALVKNCSERAPILNNKSLLQLAFSDLVSDDGELIQDVASRGLGVLFSLCDSETQENLALSLLETLTGGRKDVRKVNDDSEIFTEGMLGKTPTGANITTYKELCSLASDLNQPDLIYQFMQLANHNAAWNSKLGAAFGLQSISKAAKVKMEPYLKKIVPRLFRYKYDPTPKIQNSMCSIWDSLITDSNETVDKFYWEILEEINDNMTNVEWRVRIACCLAVRDLIKRPSGLKMHVSSGGDDEMETDGAPEPELLKLWTQLFRVMDDIHEGTRLAAAGTTAALSKVCVVAASLDHGKSGQRVAATILPFLLETGVINIVAEIRQISISTISEMIDSSGPLISKHVDTLVPSLLRATGELEASKLSYLSARHGGSNETQEAIDSVRAEAAKQHYCAETLSKCLKYINLPELQAMTPGVLDVMKTTVNLGSKITCAHFICSVSTRLGKEIQPLCAKYIKACFTSLTDRNMTVRKYYASAIGHLIGYAKDVTITKTLQSLNTLYFEQQSNRAIPQVVNSTNKRHPELLKDFSSHILPLIFFAMHEEVNDENRSTVELWKDLWLDISPGDAGIRLNLEPIVIILEKSIDDSSWLLKAQSSNAMSTIATRLGTNLDAENRIRLIKVVLKGMPGRTFVGKEKFVNALASLNKDLSKNEMELKTKIIDALIKEAKKEEPIYRTHALKALGDVLDVSDIDRFEEVYNMVWYLLDKQDLGNSDDDAKTMTSDEKNKKAGIFITLKETVCLTLGKAWPVNSIETQEKYQKLFVEKCVACLQSNTRPVQLSLLIALGKYLERLKLFENTDETKEKKAKIEEDKLNDLEKICQDVLFVNTYIADIPHTGLKKESLTNMLTLIKRLKENRHPKIMASVKVTFEKILPTLQRDSASEIRCRIKDIEDRLKEI